jgi:periplasmic mercuric ion binding protein
MATPPTRSEFSEDDMPTLTRCLALAAALGLFAAAAQAADDAAKTTITVPDLDCPSCAKKVAKKVAELTGVGEVKTDVEAKTVTIVPKPGSVLSPKELWEAVEKAGKTPSKLTGPSGTFDDKPKA